MDGSEFTIIMIIGGVFIFLGLIGFLWGRREETSYYGSMSTHVDVREFLDHLPGRPEPGALRTGGLICIVVGIVVIGFALGFHYIGR